jgi:branched-chain amino acid transport system ATP-binding protein
MIAPPLAPAGEILSVRQLAAWYGPVQALYSTDMHLGRGELIAILGPNGAGKSTLLRAIVGLVRSTGTVALEGRTMPRGDPARLAADGIILVPEGRGIFGPMTVAENLELGAYLIRPRSAEFARRWDKVLALFPRLRERLAQTAGSMSGGEQQMLAIGRALMANPRVLLLDEPSLGLAPRIIEEILAALGALNQAGLSIILVEQKAPLALQLADRIYLLSLGRILAELDPRDIKSHDDIAHYYFA